MTKCKLSVTSMTEADQILYLICNESSTHTDSHFTWQIIPVQYFFLLKKLFQFPKKIIYL